MAKVKIAVGVDAQRYAPGDDVTGQVIVNVLDDVTVSHVDVVLRWRTVGAANSESVVVASEKLGGGTWTAGSQERLRFSLSLPFAGPVSVSGTIVSIEWVAVATADVAWATDPVVESAFVVAATTVLEPFKHDPYAKGTVVAPHGFEELERFAKVMSEREPDSDGQQAVIVLAGFGLGLVFMLGTLASWGWLGLILMVPTILGAVAFGWRRLRPALAFLRFAPTVALSQSLVSPGDEVTVRVALKNSASAEKVEVSLVCVERATIRHGKNSRRVALHERRRVSAPAQRDGDAWVARVRVPDDAEGSLRTAWSEIQWRAVADVEAGTAKGSALKVLAVRTAARR